MQWFQIAAGLLSSIAWPTLVLVILMRFRQPLDAALVGLMQGRSVRRLKAGGVEVEWNDLEKSEQDMADAPGSFGRGHADDPVGDLYELIYHFPAAAILLAFKRVEAQLVAMADHYGVPFREERVRPSIRLVYILSDFIPDETQNALETIRKVRNQVTHLEDESEVTTIRATQYLMLTGEVLASLSARMTGNNEAPSG